MHSNGSCLPEAILQDSGFGVQQKPMSDGYKSSLVPHHMELPEISSSVEDHSTPTAPACQRLPRTRVLEGVLRLQERVGLLGPGELKVQDSVALKIHQLWPVFSLREPARAKLY